MANDSKRRESMDPQEEVARLLALNLRYAIGSQADTIILLHRAGFGRTRIAELIGTTAGTVNQEIIRATKKERKKGATTEKPQA